MKKCLAVMLLCSAPVFAAPRLIPQVDTIGPATSQSKNIVISSTTQTTLVRQCLTEFRVSVSSGSAQTNITGSVLDNGTTIYTMDASTGNAIVGFWNETDPLCVQPGHYIGLTSTGATAGTVINIDYKGYSY